VGERELDIFNRQGKSELTGHSSCEGVRTKARKGVNEGQKKHEKEKNGQFPEKERKKQIDVMWASTVDTRRMEKTGGVTKTQKKCLRRRGNLTTTPSYPACRCEKNDSSSTEEKGSI